MSGMAVSGIAQAGRASGNKFSVIGSLRASAQMISCYAEIPMGLSLIPIVLLHLYDSLDLTTIVERQSSLLGITGLFSTLSRLYVC